MFYLLNVGFQVVEIQSFLFKIIKVVYNPKVDPSQNIVPMIFFMSSLLMAPYFLFKWLSYDKKQPYIVIQDSPGTTVDMGYSNQDYLDIDIVDLINNENKNAYQLEIISYIFKYRTRLTDHIASLNKNSALNLIIGLVATVVDVAVLYTVLVTQDYKEPLQFFARLSLGIFIEMSAFFFLRLYSANLFEIKYFHNELSNIESKIIALKVSLLQNDTDSLKLVLKELMKTERNRIIKKGETSIDLEKMRFDKEESTVLIDKLTKAFEAVLQSVSKDKASK